MAKKKNQKEIKKIPELNVPESFLSEKKKRYLCGTVFFFLALIFILSFLEKAGIVGKFLSEISHFLIGKTFFILPPILILTSFVFFFSPYRKIFLPLILAIFAPLFGFSGILECLKPEVQQGGFLGEILAFPFLKLFGSLLTQIIFSGLILVGISIFWYLLKKSIKKESTEAPIKTSLIRRIFTPSFKIKEVPSSPSEKIISVEPKIKPKESPFLELPKLKLKYEKPPLLLLDSDKGTPLAGDIKQNSAIIKKTLENFNIPIEMGEVNIGPTVTQYTLKPADGIKLSKITTLSNDLALALASHPIRIEAPIPGKSLVGIEVPNKTRSLVCLRDLISLPQFQNSSSNLTFVLGRSVSGNPVFADLARMPHLLVAGSTGTGKTIFLNSLILSLLYRNSPEILRFILIDPKRVEFPIYNELPHLLAPVILDAQKTINVLKWLIEEMEKRFDILAEFKTRDIKGFNQIASKTSDLDLMPYIILIIDELADLMSARGKEIEAGIVRLAQMARAVGIHLVLATQRPSVEVITGLIKANITSRIAFQVASQVDSRTILDMAGAEKLLGMGDLLFISSENPKPKRIQGAYVSEKEVKKVVNWIKSRIRNQKLEIDEEIFENDLAKDLEKSLETPEGELETFSAEEDPLYQEAKKVVIEAKKASASLLQRKLRIGYARAARLIDMLEERGVVGPNQGAKPREVYFKNEENSSNDDWQKI